MVASVLVIGPKGVGKKQLLREISRSVTMPSQYLSAGLPTAGGSSSSAAPASTSVPTDESASDQTASSVTGSPDEASSSSCLSVHVKNKYFDRHVALRVVPLDEEDLLDDLLHEKHRDTIAGVIAVVHATAHSAANFDWCRFPSWLPIRLLLCRTGGPQEDRADTRTYNERTQGWYEGTVAHGVEFVPYRYVEPDPSAAVPRANIEKSGLLGEELVGAERVLQVLHGINFGLLDNSRSSSSPPGSAVGNSVPSIISFAEQDPNTVAFVSPDSQQSSSLLHKLFKCTSDRGEEQQKQPKSTLKGEIDVLSGRVEKYKLDNKYYALDFSARLLSSFHFAPSMLDLLRLGGPRNKGSQLPSYRAVYFVISSTEELPQLVPAFECFRRVVSQSTIEYYLIVQPPPPASINRDDDSSSDEETENFEGRKRGREGKKRKKISPGGVMTSTPPAVHPLIFQWAKNNGVECVIVPHDDDGQRRDREDGSQGLARLKEVLELAEWDMTHAKMKSIPPFSPSSAVSASSSKKRNALADFVGSVFEKHERTALFLSSGISPAVFQHMWELCSLPKPAKEAEFTAFVTGQWEGKQGKRQAAAFASVWKTKYYETEVIFLHIAVDRVSAAASSSTQEHADLLARLCAMAREVHSVFFVAEQKPITTGSHDTDEGEAKESQRAKEGRMKLLHELMEVRQEETLEAQAEGTSHTASPQSGGAASEVGERVTALVTLLPSPTGAHRAPAVTAADDEESLRVRQEALDTFWADDQSLSSQHGSDSPPVENIDAYGEPTRLKEALDSTQWPLTQAEKEKKKKEKQKEREAKMFGCALPPDFHMHPVSLVSERVPSNWTMSQLTDRISLVKKHGHSLPSYERERQAAYLANRMGDAMDLGEDIQLPS